MLTSELVELITKEITEKVEELHRLLDRVPNLPDKESAMTAMMAAVREGLKPTKLDKEIREKSMELHRLQIARGALSDEHAKAYADAVTPVPLTTAGLEHLIEEAQSESEADMWGFLLKCTREQEAFNARKKN